MTEAISGAVVMSDRDSAVLYAFLRTAAMRLLEQAQGPHETTTQMQALADRFMDLLEGEGFTVVKKEL